MEQQIRAVLNSAIANHIFPGCVVGIVKFDGANTIIPMGKFTYEAGSPKVTADNIFDIASITKSIPTTCLALQLIDESKIGLHDAVNKYLPHFINNDVMVSHLLTQTLDWGFALSSLKDKSADEILEAIFTAKFQSPPGARQVYSNATSILLGLVIESASGKKLDELADEQFFKPLGMTRTSFHPERFDINDIVPTENDPWRGRLLRGEIHDETAWKLKQKIIPGSAGLFSTVPDLLNFLEMLLKGGEINGRRYFSRETIEQMNTNQLTTNDVKAVLGWQIFKPGMFGKTGFTGCLVACDLKEGKALAMLSNHIHPQRSDSNKLINDVRNKILSLL